MNSKNNEHNIRDYVLFNFFHKKLNKMSIQGNRSKMQSVRKENFSR
jgi:hypothetical protein